MSDWIHTIRGAKFVDHTVPELIKALNRHSKESLDRNSKAMEELSEVLIKWAELVEVAMDRFSKSEDYED